MIQSVTVPHHNPPLQHKPIFWDALVTLCILVPGILSYQLITVIHSPIATAAAVCLWIGMALTIYGSFIEPRIITVNKKVVRIKSLPDIKIAVMADQHVGPYKRSKFVARAVRKIMSLKADIIVLPGDFIYDHLSDVTHLKPLGGLNAPLGVYAILGNHDSGCHLEGGLLAPKTRYNTEDRADEIAALITSFGITMLRNTSKTLTVDHKKFAIAGIDDLWMKSCNLRKALDVSKEHPTILLSHNPDVILEKDHAKAALIISGHTHGGQVRLPIIGALAGIPDKLGKKYDQGIFHLQNGTVLAITHGIGETMGRMRLFCPPEILLLANLSKPS